jgi:4-amino-4-deoxy-L-arabinose transferase-like glycosyltransferase
VKGFWKEDVAEPLGAENEPSPLRMLLFGAASLVAAVAVTPSVACGLYPLVTTAEFGESIPTDASAMFVFISTLFIAFYKLLNEFWRRLRRRKRQRGKTIKVMAVVMVVLIAVVSSIALEVSCAEDEDREPATDVEAQAE